MSENKIRKFRQEQGYNMVQFSKKSGVSLAYLSRLEKGTRNNPSRDVMEKISLALNKSIAEIFFSEE